ncbi:MAG: serine hydrolase [Gemmatimonadales bacterium]|nr:serine hydrolase [Gemmatimonadales bacterium]
MRAPRLATAIGLALTVAAPSARAQAPLDAIDSLVRAEQARQRIPGVAVLVVRRDSVLLARGWGEANVEHAVPVTDETFFQSGSVGKQFTAALVLLLAEEGRLRLDDRAVRWLPSLGPRWRGVTIRHLLTHTSGIPDYGDATLDLRREYTEAALVRLAARLEPEFAPGARWAYSNTGYVLLGCIIRQATGRFYGDLLRERLFTPLGMATARVISDAAIVPHRAAGYELAGDSLRNQAWVSPSLNTTADGSLYLSLRDYAAWDRALRRGALLSASSWQAATTPATLRSGARVPYGFGWAVDTVGGQPVFRHGGAWQGFRTSIARYQGRDVTVVVLANLAQAAPEDIGDRIAQLVDPALVPTAGEEDPDPAGTEAALRTLLARTAAGRLARADFAWAPAGFFPAAPARYAARLRPLGAVQAVRALRTARLGDDRIWQHEVRFAGGALFVETARAPDGRLTRFRFRPL